MARPVNLAFLVLIIMFISQTSTSSLVRAVTYDVQSLGAKPDGKSDSSKAFMAAWSQACASKQPATIYVPTGKYSIGKVQFQGPCNNNAILVQIDGTLVAPSDYRVIGYSSNWIAPSDYRVIGNSTIWIAFEHVDGVTVSGGILDGQGSALWSCKKSGKTCLPGATSLEFSDSNNILISGMASLNSQMFHIVINKCENVKIQGVKISAAANSPNTDGIHVESSSHVTILASRIATGDDCVSIGPGTSNIWIESIACGPGHGISIGSLGKKSKEAGVQNVTVKTATFTGTQNGVRIKAWGRPSTGFAKNVLFQNIIINNAQNPIVIDQNYCPDDENCPDQASGVKISDVTYENIHGISATEVAVKFDCSKKNPCSGIRLEDVKLTYDNQPAQASCANAGGYVSGYVQPTSCLYS